MSYGEHVLTTNKRICDDAIQKVVTDIRIHLDASNPMTVHDDTWENRKGQAISSSVRQKAVVSASAAFDPSKLALRDILTVGNEIRDTPADRYLADSAVCEYFVAKVRGIGKTWEINPNWAGVDWYLQILLAISRFCRAVKWYQVRSTTEDIDDINSAPWTFVLAKLSKEKRLQLSDSKDINASRTRNPASMETPAKDKQPTPDVAGPPSSMKDFEVHDILHQGNSKSVHLAQRTLTRESVVIKVVSKADMLTSNNIFVDRSRHTIILSYQELSFVNKIHFALQSETKLYLVKEFVVQGDCAALLKDVGHLRETMTRDYVLQTVHGLEFLHEHGVVHRNLLPENILIGEGHRLQLSDFGLNYETFLRRNIDGNSGQKLADLNEPNARSFCYLTPEAILGLQTDDDSIDWWALGILTYEFLCGIPPFWVDSDLGPLVQRILAGRMDWSSSPDLSLAARDFVQSLLNLDTVARCSSRGAESVKAHSFFASVRDRMPAMEVDSDDDYLSALSPPPYAAIPTQFMDINLHRPVPAEGKGRNLPISHLLSRAKFMANFGSSQTPQTELSRRRPAALSLTRRQSSDDSSLNLFPIRRPTNNSGRSTPSSAGRGWPSSPSLRRKPSRNSSEGRGSSWLSGYTTTDSEPESPESAFELDSHSPLSWLERKKPDFDRRLSRDLLQQSLDVTGQVDKLEKYPFESGNVADIYRGILRTSQSPVAVKIFRRMHAEKETLEQTTRYLYEEARVWQELCHPNILPFLGISLDLGLSPALISPLCTPGPIMKYLHSNPQMATKKLQLVIGVAEGLDYLHSKAIVHGNLSTKKVLIDEHGLPVICGYGMARALQQPAYTTSIFSAPIRFAAPECFSERSNNSTRTTSGDVYAFAMIIFGMQPYHHLPTEHAVLMHIMRGGRPTRTHLDHTAISTQMWQFLASLWHEEPSARPTMNTVVHSVIHMRDKPQLEEEATPDSEPEADSSSHNVGKHTTSSGSEASDSLGDIMLPEIHRRDLKGRVSQEDQYPFAGGGNSNIYRGKLTRSNGRKIRVAIKMIRMSDDGSGQFEDILRRLKREVDVWARLRHKNVLPFIGVCHDLAPWPVLISPFYKFGHVGTYLNKRPDADRRALVLGIASGLRYLHAQDVVHGDLKAQNVLVDKRGDPCICDFGISKILNRRGFTTSSVGTSSYMAPELFFVVDCQLGPGSTPSPSTTKSSDVYSFGLLVLEILTSEPPKGRPTRPIATRKILAELQPNRADYDEHKISDKIWSLLDRCWAFEPRLRPETSDVLQELNNMFLDGSDLAERSERN